MTGYISQKKEEKHSRSVLNCHVTALIEIGLAAHDSQQHALTKPCEAITGKKQRVCKEFSTRCRDCVCVSVELLLNPFRSHAISLSVRM